MTKALNLEGYLRGKGSPLADHVPALLQASHRWRVDPRLIVSIAGAETSFGKAGGGPSVFNAWGVGPGKAYSSWQDGLNSVAKLLRQSYLNQGLNTLPKIQRKWAPVGAGNDPRNLNSAWLNNTNAVMRELGGTAMDVTSGWRKPTAPSTQQAAQQNPNLFTPLQTAGLQNLNQIAMYGHIDPSQLLSGLVNAISLNQQQPSKGATAASFPTTTGPGSSVGKGIVRTARTQLGIPYQWGGAAKLGSRTDCSGLLQAAALANGIHIPRTTYDQFKVGKRVARQNLRPGDAVFFRPGPNGPEHVGIYIGNGNMIEDPHTGAAVRVADFAHRNGYVGARRYG
jgi:cell wall-associated NlpC family hydrolase